MSSNSLQVRFEKRFSAGWTMLASLHLPAQHRRHAMKTKRLVPSRKTPTTCERNAATSVPISVTSSPLRGPTNCRSDPGSAIFNSEGPARWVAGGWQLNGIVTIYSGQAITPLLSFDDTNTGSGGARPDILEILIISPMPRKPGAPRIPSRCNAGTIPPLSALLYPALAPGQTFAHMYGDAGRGTLRGPAQYNTDFSAFKTFQLKESLSMELRGEVFNLFNTPEFAPPNATVDIPGSFRLDQQHRAFLAAIADRRAVQVLRESVFSPFLERDK